MASNEIYAGVDIGGTKVAVALGTAAGQLLAYGSVAIASGREPGSSSERSPSCVLERTAQLIESLAEQCGANPAAIGVGLPGLVSVSTGTAEFLPTFQGCGRVPKSRKCLVNEPARMSTF